MTFEEQNRIIANTPESDRTMEAFLGFLESCADDAADLALVGGIDPHERAYNCGRAAVLRAILLEIAEMRESAKNSSNY